MKRRNFLQLLAAVPFVGWMVPKREPSLNEQLEDALTRHEFQPPIKPPRDKHVVTYDLCGNVQFLKIGNPTVELTEIDKARIIADIKRRIQHSGIS